MVGVGQIVHFFNFLDAKECVLFGGSMMGHIDQGQLSGGMSLLGKLSQVAWSLKLIIN